MKKNALALGTSYFGNRFLRHAKKDLADIASCCGYVVLPFSETDLYFHKAAYEEMVKESKKRKLKVWADPWALAGVFGGEAFSKFLLDNRRSWQFLSDGRSVPAACFNSAEFINYMKLWIKTVSDCGVDTIFWDEPHFYVNLDLELKGIYSCCCWLCREKYNTKYGEMMPQKLNDNVKAFRLDSLEYFLESMMKYSKSLGLDNAITIYAIKGINEYDKIWERAASLEHSDVFGCDPYWRWHFKNDPVKHVGAFSRKVRESASAYNKEGQIWIQAMRIPAGREREINDAVFAAYDNGIRNIAAWSYDGGELLDGLYSPRYELVWQAVKKAFLKLRAKHD